MKIEELIKNIGDSATYISSSSEYICDNLDEITTENIVYTTKAIIANNRSILIAKENEIQSFEEKISELGEIPIPETPEEEISNETERLSKEKKYLDIDPIIIELIEKHFTEELKTQIDNLSNKDIIRLKLFFMKEVVGAKKRLRTAILKNPLADISNIQQDLTDFEEVIEFIEMEEKKVIESAVPEEYYKCFLVPNLKGSSFAYEDALSEIGQLNELKVILSKIKDNYFLKTDRIKNIIKYDEKLREYTNANGFRILYIEEGNMIFICSIFYKDKQRSTSIDGKYQEAIRRYENTKKYILDNINNPEFYIEQEELLNQLFSIVDEKGKKGGIKNG